MISMGYALSSISGAREIAMQLAPGWLPSCWWAVLVVLGVLIAAAVVDAFTAEVPEPFIFFGLFFVAVTQGFCASWDKAAEALRQAVTAGLVIWFINFVWYKKFRHDALGMGDAKWTMLAVACFGVTPVLIAWGAGAVLAVAFIGAAWLFHSPVSRVTFLPFLLAGLGVGLYLTRFLGAR